MHPNVKVVAIFDEDVTGWKGAHQAFQVREFADEGLGCFAAVNLPPSILAMSFPHRGAALGRLMEQYNHMMVAGLLCEDTTTGRVRTINGRPQAFYQLGGFKVQGKEASAALALVDDAKALEAAACFSVVLGILEFLGEVACSLRQGQYLIQRMRLFGA